MLVISLVHVTVLLNDLNTGIFLYFPFFSELDVALETDPIGKMLPPPTFSEFIQYIVLQTITIASSHLDCRVVTISTYDSGIPLL